jgi:hypothetical protein
MGHMGTYACVRKSAPTLLSAVPKIAIAERVGRARLVDV